MARTVLYILVTLNLYHPSFVPELTRVPLNMSSLLLYGPLRLIMTLTVHLWYHHPLSCSSHTCEGHV